MQRHLTTQIGCAIAMALCLMVPFGGAANHVSPNSPLDEYGPICWEHEKARLDNFAFSLLNTNRTTLGHIIVYDGKLACRGEAIARAMRAKKYLVEYHKVPADRIVWRWGGYRDDAWTTLVIHPAGASIWPFWPSLPLADVKFVGKCNRKARPVKCRPGW
jgi:hypothetical protein